MALTKVSGDFIKAGSITQGHLHSSHGITTSHIAEGDKLFFTNARVDSRVGSLSTSDLSEGTNLYYTDARARAAINVSGNALSYNSSTGVMTSNFEESPTFTGNVTIDDGKIIFERDLNNEVALEFSNVDGVPDDTAKLKVQDKGLLWEAGGTNGAKFWMYSGSWDSTVFLNAGTFNIRAADSTSRAVFNSNGLNITDDLTVTGGDINLVGTGRIQGIDTVSADTDAANKLYVDNQVAGIVDSAPSTLDTLNELAAALGDDANFSTTVTNSIALKAPLASPTFTGSSHFTGNVEVGDGTNISMDSSSNGQLMIDGNGYQGAIALDDQAMYIYHNSSGRNLVLGTNETARLTITGGGNATFTGTITASGYNDSNWNTAYTYSQVGHLPLAGGTITSGTSIGLTINHNTFEQGLVLHRNHATNAASIVFKNNTGMIGTLLAISSDNQPYWQEGTGTDSYKIWTANNDGSGSGLDADLLDGQQGSHYLNYSNFTGTPTIPTDFVSAASGGTFGGAVTIEQDGDALNLRSTTNAVKPRITFSDHAPTATQIGHIEYTHVNTASYGSGEAFIIGGTESTITVLADGKLMYNEGIYSKPASGTGAGTRKDSNWDTAYGWGDHAAAGYLTSVPSHNHDDRYYTETETNNLLAGKASLNDVRSLGTQAFTGTATTAGFISEIESDGAFDSYTSFFKHSWSYAGNDNLADAGRFTETAGASFITWTDNSSDSTRGNITVLAIAPNTGGSAGKMFVYNDQGSSYAPGWREIWCNTSDGSGSGLDADLLDGQHASAFQPAGNYLTSFDITTQTDGKYLRSNADDSFTGKLVVGNTGNRRAGMYGIYDSTKTGHIWSMGSAYQIPQNGADFGNLYGLAYKHTNNTTGGTMASGHQMVWCANGTPKSAIGTNIWTGGDAYAGIFYDSNDTAYYTDLNAGSRLHRLGVGTTPRTDSYSLSVSNIYMGNTSIDYATQLHFHDNVRFYDDGNDSYLNFKYGDSNYGGIVFYNGSTARRGFVYADNAGFGMLDSDGQWSVRIPIGGVGLELRSNNNVEFTVNNDHTLSHGSSRAPIFYDSDNTGYYVNPASTSNLNAATFAGDITVNGNQVITDDANAEVKFSVWSGTTYGIGMHSGVTLGHLNGYAMTFCMNNDTNRGFWWGYSGQSKSAGAMALTTNGRLTVTNRVVAPNYYVDGYIYHNGDTNTYIRMVGGDDMQLVAGGRQMIRMDEGGDPDRLRFVTDSNWTDSSGNWAMSGYITVQGAVYSNDGIIYDKDDSSAYYRATGTSTPHGDIFFQSTNSIWFNSQSTSSNYLRLHGGTSSGAYFDFNSTGSTKKMHWRQYGTHTRFTWDYSTAAFLAMGSITANGSDERLKENIVTIDDALNKVKQMRGVYFNRTDIEPDKKRVGFIAQEVKPILPEVVEEAGLIDGYSEFDDDQILTISYANITALIVEAVKEQQTIIDDLKSRLETLENQ